MIVFLLKLRLFNFLFIYVGYVHQLTFTMLKDFEKWLFVRFAKFVKTQYFHVNAENDLQSQKRSKGFKKGFRNFK